MKITGLLLGFVFLVGLPLQAQKAQVEGSPKAEIFGGFSYLNFDFPTVEGISLGRQNFVGWQSSVSANITKSFALATEFSGQYGNIVTIPIQGYGFLFGPRFTNRREKLTVFSHLLVGVAHTRALGISGTNFATATGVGLDVNVSDRVAIRVFQVDYAPIYDFNEGMTFHNMRAAFGVVFKFGGK